MRTTIKFLIITVLFAVVPCEIQSQSTTRHYPDDKSAALGTFSGLQDTLLQTSPVTPGTMVLHGGIGFGYMMKGGYFSLKGKFVSPSRWGSSLDLKSCSWKTKNLPSDYSPLFYPRDECLAVSLNLVRSLTGTGQSPRISAEAGLSWIRTENEKVIPNPDYDPNSIWHLSRYLRSNDVENALGFSISINTEIPLAPFMLLDFSVFGNLNPLASFLGIGLYLGFGDVKD